MTEPTELIPGEPFMPAMDAVYRFMRSNPQTSCMMLIETLGLGKEEKAEVSRGRLLELWKLAGGAVDKKGNAWVEIEELPAVLRVVIDAEKVASTADGGGEHG